MQFSVDLFRTLNINRYRFVNFSQKNKKQQPSLCNVVKIVQFVLKLCVVVTWKENSNPVVSLSRNFRSDLSRLPGALFIFLETWWKLELKTEEATRPPTILHGQRVIINFSTRRIQSPPAFISSTPTLSSPKIPNNTYLSEA